MAGGKINSFYEASCHYESLISSPAAAAAPGTSSSSSTSVVFKVQSILRLSVAEGNPATEFLEEKNWLETSKLFSEPPWCRDRIIIDENHWRETRQSCLELPWSIDGILLDGSNTLKISETLAVLRVPEVSHQSIMDSLRLGAAAISHYRRGLAPNKVSVEIGEVTHITLPVIDEEGKAIYPEHRDYYDDDEYANVDDPVLTQEERVEREEKEEQVDKAQFIDYLMKLIVGAREDINEEDEDTLISDWFWKLFYAIVRLAQQVTQKKEEEEKGEKEQTCPICMEIFKPDEAWSKMPCCSQVFHRDCISMWTKRLKKCPWCRSSLPLVLQSAKGIDERLASNRMFCHRLPGFHHLLVILWNLLAETVWWTDFEVHEASCECGCRAKEFLLTRA